LIALNAQLLDLFRPPDKPYPQQIDPVWQPEKPCFDANRPYACHCSQRSPAQGRFIDLRNEAEQYGVWDCVDPENDDAEEPDQPEPLDIVAYEKRLEPHLRNEAGQEEQVDVGQRSKHKHELTKRGLTHESEARDYREAMKLY